MSPVQSNPPVLFSNSIRPINPDHCWLLIEWTFPPTSFPLIFLSSVKDTSFYPHQRHNSLPCNHPIIYYFVTYYQVIPTEESLAKLTEAQYAITQEGCTERWLNILLLLKKLTINGIQKIKRYYNDCSGGLILPTLKSQWISGTMENTAKTGQRWLISVSMVCDCDQLSQSHYYQDLASYLAETEIVVKAQEV